MAFFSKPKNAEAVTPQMCHRCREQLGTVHVRWFGRPPADANAGPEKNPVDWWLCSACAEVLRRNEPPSS
jgi:hypothetical protein